MCASWWSGRNPEGGAGGEHAPEVPGGARPEERPAPRGTPEPVPVAAAGPAALPGGRCRSVCFLERDGSWTTFLATYPRADGWWGGRFIFRSAGDVEAVEVRTANLFVEATEAEVDARARGMGRPLLLALLESALHTHQRMEGPSADMRRWFRDVLARHAAELVPRIGGPPAELSLTHLRSLYDSYRLDQFAHLIALVEPAAFAALVDRVLEGRRIDFGARDRLQLAMMVVQELEARLPLPPFEVWVEDYMAHPEEYRRYSHALHREPELP
jgi:hypothetical protein